MKGTFLLSSWSCVIYSMSSSDTQAGINYNNMNCISRVYVNVDYSQTPQNWTDEKFPAMCIYSELLLCRDGGHTTCAYAGDLITQNQRNLRNNYTSLLRLLCTCKHFPCALARTCVAMFVWFNFSVCSLSLSLSLSPICTHTHIYTGHYTHALTNVLTCTHNNIIVLYHS